MSEHDVTDSNEIDTPAPVGETKAQAFKRLGTARMNAALHKIRLLGNLSAYEYTDMQVARMREALNDALDQAFKRFSKQKDKDDGFDFGEERNTHEQ